MVSLTQPTDANNKRNGRKSATLKAPVPRWQLKLNTSLDVRDVLTTFFTGITSMVPCANLRYQNPVKKITIELGGAKQHSAQYGLKAGGYDLGEITFTRSDPFAEDELKQLEDGLSILFYPLRNALLYKEALDSSLRDPLTELSNRAAFELAVKRELGIAKRHNQLLSMIVIDIDHFKKVNDTAGHHTGDLLLKHVAQTLKETLRETDQLFRFGGEEFVVLLSNANIAAAARVAERTRKVVESTGLRLNDCEVGASISMGVSTFSSEDDRDSLFQRADEALYLAKNSGRNCVKTEWDLLDAPSDSGLNSRGTAQA
ncbi:MAG TPA: GGDEF domain-containing protein [Marinagarivorans sp.]